MHKKHEKATTDNLASEEAKLMQQKTSKYTLQMSQRVEKEDQKQEAGKTLNEFEAWYKYTAKIKHSSQSTVSSSIQSSKENPHDLPVVKKWMCRGKLKNMKQKKAQQTENPTPRGQSKHNDHYKWK